MCKSPENTKRCTNVRSILAQCLISGSFVFATLRYAVDVLIPNVCETQWRHSVKTRLYNTPSPHTSCCETQWRHSVKTRLYKNPPPYLIVLSSSVKTKEVEVIEFHRIPASCNEWGFRPTLCAYIAKLGQENLLRRMRWHCPPDT